MSRPAIVQGRGHVDARGTVRPVCGFSLGTANRFYVIAPARADECRGWMVHRRDSTAGESTICLETGGRPKIFRARLSDKESRLLEAPGEFAVAIQAPSPARLIVVIIRRIEAALEIMFQLTIGDFEPLELA